MQYAYYKAGNSKVKKQSGSAARWWGRSPSSGESDRFCFVTRDGVAGDSLAGNSRGVAFGFCV